MKKKILFFVLLSFSVSGFLFSQYTLKVKITGIRKISGSILMELYTAKHSLLKQEKADITNYECTVTFYDLKPSKYAIRYFHDENKNYTLDLNWIGIPTEGYGFSNNVLGAFGPPEFDKWIFDIKENSVLNLKIKYQ
jgi:uncharacterized protein (DUF2141 family)